MIIDSFTGPYDFLSNGYREPDGSTVEHEYQAYSKTTDPEWRQKILLAPVPFGRHGAKRLGRQAPLRSDHDEIKISVMGFFVAKKFRDPLLRAQLLATEPAMLIEGNMWHDNIWGDCRCRNAHDLHPECLELGTNWLGIVLMTVRATLRLGDETR